jgi:hypothetical protein
MQISRILHILFAATAAFTLSLVSSSHVLAAAPGTTTIDRSGVVDCTGAKTQGWYAWNDLMPPKPDWFHLVGEVQVGNPGVQAVLTPRIPQGANGAILLLDLSLHQQSGIWPQQVTWVPARYDKVLTGAAYTQVQVFCNDKVIHDMKVETVH